MKHFVSNIFRVWKMEFGVVRSDLGVLIFIFLLPLAYPLIYSAVYNPELVREVPVMVVDEGRTAFTREYVRKLDATPEVKIIGYAVGMGEARQSMAERDCYGVVRFPSDFTLDIGRGNTAVVEVYCDMSLLLRYRAVLTAVTEVSDNMGVGVQKERITEMMGEDALVSGTLPIPYKLEPVGNVSQGLASAIMPGVLVLILQQCVVLAICFLGSTSRERARTECGCDPMEVVGTGSVSRVIGKALCYFTLMILPTVFVVHFVPIIFDYPMNGDVWDLAVFFVPYLFATIFFGMTVQSIVPDRETTFLVFVFTSVAFIFLSSISWPRYAMSEFWRLVGDCIPSTWGVNGFVAMNTTGATLDRQPASYIILWFLAAVYFIAACFLYDTKVIKRKKMHYSE